MERRATEPAADLRTDAALVAWAVAAGRLCGRTAGRGGAHSARRAAWHRPGCGLVPRRVPPSRPDPLKRLPRLRGKVLACDGPGPAAHAAALAEAANGGPLRAERPALPCRPPRARGPAATGRRSGRAAASPGGGARWAAASPAGRVCPIRRREACRTRWRASGTGADADDAVAAAAGQGGRSGHRRDLLRARAGPPDPSRWRFVLHARYTSPVLGHGGSAGDGRSGS
jgi:hypothetical protein